MFKLARRIARLAAVTSIEFGAVFSLGLYAYPGAGFVPYLLDPRRSDFALYYRDALIALTYGWRHLYDVGRFAEVTAHVGVISKDPLTVTSLSMPQLTWLVFGLAGLPLNWAYALWVGFLGVLIAATLAALAPAGARVFHAAMLLTFAPALMAWGAGQSVVIEAAGVAAAAVLMWRRRELAAGVVLGLASVKPQLLVAVPVCLLAAGRWRVVAGWMAALLGVVAIHSVLVGEAGLADWVHRLLSASASPTRWQVTTSVTAVLLVPAGPVRVCLQLAGVAAAAALARTRRQEPGSVVAIGIVGSLLVTPYVHYPDFLLLLVAAWLLLRDGTLGWERWLMAAGFSQAVLAATALPEFLVAVEVAYLAGRPVRAGLEPLMTGLGLRRLQAAVPPAP